MNQYYEAIIQIRPQREEVIAFALANIAKRKDVFISKTIKLKTGIDIYISSQRFARALGVQLKRRFRGEVKITRRLYGVSRETSKTLYRVTVLFRAE